MSLEEVLHIQGNEFLYYQRRLSLSIRSWDFFSDSSMVFLKPLRSRRWHFLRPEVFQI
jgi:hypothetical protein